MLSGRLLFLRWGHKHSLHLLLSTQCLLNLKNKDEFPREQEANQLARRRLSSMGGSTGG